MDAVLFSSVHLVHRQYRTARPWFRRLGILVAGLAINLVLFGVMPCLLTRNSVAPDSREAAQQINVIRLKQADSPVKRSSEKPPEPPQEHQTVKPQAAKPAPAKPAPAKLSLPFDINPRLPGGPATLTLTTVPMDRIGDIPDTFVSGDLDSPLVVLVRIPPVYPISAKKRGTEGWVKLRFIVHEDGYVGEVTVAESEPKTIFDDAVIRSVSDWRFKAGTVGGIPVKTRAETVVRFKLD